MELSSLSHFIKKHWRNTVYSNVWISLGAAASVKQTELVLNMNSKGLLPLFAFFATVCVYNYQRVVKLYNKPSYSVAGRNTWLNRHRKIIQYWAILGAISCLGLSFLLNFDSLLLLSFGGFLSLFYVIRVIPTKRGFITLRDIPYVKIYLIGLSWAILSVFFPLAFHKGIDSIISISSIFIFLEKVLFILAITIPFDTRDLKYDELEKRTLPQILGVKRSNYLALFILLGSFLCSTILYLNNCYSTQIWIAFLFSCIYTGYLIFRTGESKHELFYTGWLDGTISVQFVLVFIAWMTTAL